MRTNNSLLLPMLVVCLVLVALGVGYTAGSSDLGGWATVLSAPRVPVKNVAPEVPVTALTQNLQATPEKTCTPYDPSVKYSYRHETADAVFDGYVHNWINYYERIIKDPAMMSFESMRVKENTWIDGVLVLEEEVLYYYPTVKGCAYQNFPLSDLPNEDSLWFPTSKGSCLGSSHYEDSLTQEWMDVLNICRTTKEEWTQAHYSIE